MRAWRGLVFMGRDEIYIFFFNGLRDRASTSVCLLLIRGGHRILLLLWFGENFVLQVLYVAIYLYIYNVLCIYVLFSVAAFGLCFNNIVEKL